MKHCKHENCKQEELGNGEWIEICEDCGMSRSVWEQGESDWLMVDLKQIRSNAQKTHEEIKKFKKEN